MSRPLSKRERVEAALSGAEPDRVPVTAWGHHFPAEADPRTLAEASLAFFHEYDWDWLKVNPRASVFAEAWGAEYDHGRHVGYRPVLVRNGRVPADFGQLEPARPSHPVWSAHLDLLRTIKRGIGGAPFVQTLFSPASVLACLADQPDEQADPDTPRDPADPLLRLIRTRPGQAHQALGVIADSLAALAVSSLEAGADGVFFAITKLARTGGLTVEEFETFGKPYDFRVLKAVAGARFNALHACGSRLHWQSLQDYPVHALNWASVGQDNPGLPQARAGAAHALIGGVDELGVLRHGTPAQVRAATREALAQGGARRFLLAPGCCIDPAVPAENLRAFRDAVN